MSPLFCPHCGKQLLLVGQKFCAYCAGDLNALAGNEGPASSRRAVTTSDVRSTSDSDARDDVAFDDGSNDLDSQDPRALLEAGAAGLALIALILPIATVAVSSSYMSATASTSVSVLDLIQHTSWTQWLELDLIVFGTVAALLVGVARALDPRRFRSTAALGAFAAVVGGYVWLLLEWDSQFAQIGAVYSWLGVSLGLSQGIGLWLGLGAGIAGVLVSVTDSGSEEQSPPLRSSAVASPPYSPVATSHGNATSEE
jgi:hypothetical protein